MNVLFKFLSLFFHIFSLVLLRDGKQFYSQIPCNILQAQKLLWKTTKEHFIEFVVCPKCHSVYNYKDCYVTKAGKKESKACEHVSFPNHPQQSGRKKCGTLLLKKVKSGRGYKLVPIKVYPYQPLAKSFSYLVQKGDFLETCEKWREHKRHISPTHLFDIYDGNIWNEFEISGFLKSPYCYFHLMWTGFSPFLILSTQWVQYI